MLLIHMPRTHRTAWLLPFAVGALFFVAGCATHTATTRPSATTMTAGLDPKANLALADIPPRMVELPQPLAPATEPAEPPMEALMLYAQARDAITAGQPNRAISLYQRALALDPDSLDLNVDLARLYLLINPADERALPFLEHALALQPDDLGLQSEIARLYAAHGDMTNAIRHFRYATLTGDYRRDDERALLVDYFLGRVLEDQGYLRAALDCYTRLTVRVESDANQRSADPQLQFLIQRPEIIYSEIAALDQRLGKTGDALEAYRQIQKRRPDDLAVRQQIVRLLILLGHNDEAAEQALQAVRAAHASPESIELLRQAWRAKGNEAGASDALAKALGAHGDDPALVLARVELLTGGNRTPTAIQLLTETIDRKPDPRLIRRQVELFLARDDRDSAARVLVIQTARHPELVSQLSGLWDDLNQPLPYPAQRLADMDVPAGARPMRDYWASRVALVASRPVLAEELLDRAVAARPPVRCAWNERLIRSLAAAKTPADKRAVGKALVDAAAGAGDAGLADELTAVTALSTDDSPGAAAAFQKAIANGNRDPQIQLLLAQTARTRHDNTAFQRDMWKLISDYPSYDDAYIALVRFYQDENQPQRSALVARTWLAQDPQSTGARLLHVLLAATADDADLTSEGNEAGATAAALIRERGGTDPEMLARLREVFTHDNHLDRFAQLLSDRLTAHPSDITTAEVLISVYVELQRPTEAAAVIERARIANRGDADRLYAVAHLYDLINRPHDVSMVLEQVLKLDPNQPSANNDLGYTWADAGHDLPEAERMIRLALKAEPDNQSYLDSMGWVLYKQSRFADAKSWLEKAATDPGSADPTMLDHLGDTLYRLSDRASAADRWQQALARFVNPTAAIDPTATDERSILRLRLTRKIGQAKAHEPVDVAPVAVGPTTFTAGQ